MLLFTIIAALSCHSIQARPSQHANQANPNWTPLPALPSNRQEHSVVALQDSIYILGGTISSDPNNPSTADTVATSEYFSLSDNTWHKSQDFLLPLNHLNAAVVNDKIYILGGLKVGDSAWEATDQSMVYSPTNEQWEPIPPMPQGTARGACAVGTYKDKIYLAGGMTILSVEQDVNDIVTSYDTTTNTWDTTLPALPQPRQHVAGVVVGSIFYVIGGRTDGQLKIKSEVFALNLEDTASGWTAKASMPTARGGLACAAVEEKIYCMGGEGNPDPSSKGVFGQVEVYDTINDEWSKLEDMPVARHGWGVAVLGGKIYVPGGGVTAGTAPTDYFDVFTP